MAKLLKNITVEINSSIEADVQLVSVTAEYGEGDFIDITNHCGFYQDLENATELIQLDKPGFFGLNNDGRTEHVIEISY